MNSPFIGILLNFNSIGCLVVAQVNIILYTSYKGVNWILHVENMQQNSFSMRGFSATRATSRR